MSNSSGIVLDLDFAEKSGAVAGDSSRYGNDGALTGGKWVEHGLEFNGSSDYVNCGNDASLNPISAMSINLWIRPNITYDSGSPSAWNIFVKKNNIYEFGWQGWTDGITFKINGDNVYSVIYPIDLITGMWYNMVGTYNSSGGIIYVNGVAVSTDSDYELIDQNNDNMTIGGYSAVDSFNGIIDDPRIYNRALNASEIKAYYDSTKHRYK